MNQIRASLCCVVLCSSIVSPALGAEPEKPAAVIAYEECAAGVFTSSNRVSNILAECEAEMEAFLALQDEVTREGVTPSDETEKPAAVTAYEQCATRVFSRSGKVSDVFAGCEAEMDAYLALHDEAIRDKVRQLAMAEIQRTLRAPSRTSTETEDNKAGRHE
jgi:hypothetical protein